VLLKKKVSMNNLSKQTITRLLLAVGVGIALAVALDNIAIGIGVAAVFVFGILVREQKKTE